MPQLTKNIFEELSESIMGDVYTDTVRRYLHSTDGSYFRVEPACVVYPTDVNDVVTAVKFASRYGLSIHSRGAGSGLCGSAIGNGIVLDFAKYMNRIEELDVEGKTFTCQPGFRLGELDVELKGKGLFFPPDPSSGEYATFGGMYGTNASGAHSVKYGNVADYIEDAEFVTTEGKVYTFSGILETDLDKLDEPFKRLVKLYYDNTDKIENGYPDIKFNVSGYNLKSLINDDGKLFLGRLLGGSEGTLAVVTKLKFRLLAKPTHDSLVVAYFDNIINSAKAVQAILPMNPAGIEIMDKSLLALAKDSDEKLREAIPDGYDNVCMIEFDGYSEEETLKLAEEAKAILAEKNLSPEMHMAAAAEEKAKFWAIRKAAVPILYKLKSKKKILALIEDAAVPTDKLVEYFEGLYALLEEHKADFVIYGHIAKGLLHTRPMLDLKDPYDIEMLKKLDDGLFSIVNSLGGTVSGEHGDGRLRSCYIKKQYGELNDVFLEAKSILDPERRLNPEIKTHHDEYQMMKYLRFGKDYRSKDMKEKLIWSEGFTDEAEKCHGCSKCTTVTTATRMCPVYKVTRDEYSAPKAKANILRALISGSVDDKAIYEKVLQEVINHCVACGSCHIECPSNVNIPKLSMEAKSQYVKRYGAKLSDRIPTQLETMGRKLRKITWALEPVMKFKTPRKVMELASGIAAEREFMPLERESLFDQLKGHKSPESSKKVLFFSGCYAGYVRPSIGTSAVKVLEAAGIEVIVPEQHCCGLPHLSKGMRDGSLKKIDQNLASWGKLIDEVDHIVVTCTSCGLSLYKEWSYVKNDEMVQKVKDKLIHISTLLNSSRDKLELGTEGKKLAYHKSCHFKGLPDNDSSITLLKSIEGVELDDLASNCCGMAGSWGMKADNYKLSTQIGDPMTSKLNNSAGDVGVTDCPTCTMQMEHMSKKPIKHPIEVVAECLKK